MFNFLFSIETIINEAILGLPRRWFERWVLPTISLWLPPLIVIGVLLLSGWLGFALAVHDNDGKGLATDCPRVEAKERL